MKRVVTKKVVMNPLTSFPPPHVIPAPSRHSRAGGNLIQTQQDKQIKIPAFARMTDKRSAMTERRSAMTDKRSAMTDKRSAMTIAIF